MQKQTLGSHEELSDEELEKELEDAKKFTEQELKDHEGELEDAQNHLDDTIEKGKQENTRTEKAGKTGKGGGGSGGGSQRGLREANPFSLGEDTRMVNLQRLVDLWVKKLLSKPISKLSFDPSERSKRVPGLWGRELEVEIRNKGEKVLIVVVDTSGSITPFYKILKRILYSLSEKLVKGKAVTKILLLNIEGDQVEGAETLIPIARFKPNLESLLQYSTATDAGKAWNKIKVLLKKMGRKVEEISGTVVVTDFEFTDSKFKLPDELYRTPILGIGIVPYDDIAQYKPYESNFMSQNPKNDLRVIRVFGNGEVHQVLRKDIEEEENK